MGFTLPLTRLAFKHLRPLSGQKLGSPATLTTWVSTFYVRLTDSLEFQDAILTWILTKLYNEAPPRNVELRLNHEAPPRNLREITSWPWDTTTKPLWNYVLTMRHHHATLLELRPDHETPPRNPRGITSWPWGTTTKPL